MELQNNLELQRLSVVEGEDNITDEIAKQELTDLIDGLFSWAVEWSDEDKVLFHLQNSPALKAELLEFLMWCLDSENKEEEMERFNSLKFDDNWDESLNREEFDRFKELMNKSIWYIVNLDYENSTWIWFTESWVDSFKEAQADIKDDIFDLSFASVLENKFDWTLSDEIFTWLNWIWDEELRKMESLNFDDEWYFEAVLKLSWKEAVGVYEDLVKIIYDIYRLTIQWGLAQYAYYGFRDWAEYDMKYDAMVESSPILSIISSFPTTSEEYSKIYDSILNLLEEWPTAWTVAKFVGLLLSLIWWGIAAVWSLASKSAWIIWKLWKGMKNVWNTIWWAWWIVSWERLEASLAWGMGFWNNFSNEVSDIVDDGISKTPEIQGRYADISRDWSNFKDNWLSENPDLARGNSSFEWHKSDLPEAEKIDLQELDRTLDSFELNKWNISPQEKANIIWWISKNHPALSIVNKCMQKPWELLTMMWFSWIKKLNDTIGQDAVDDIISSFKSKVMSNHWLDLIQDDYKRFMGFWDWLSHDMMVSYFQDSLKEHFKNNSWNAKYSYLLDDSSIWVSFHQEKIPDNPTQESIFMTIWGARWNSVLERQIIEAEGRKIYEEAEIPNAYSSFASEYYNMTDMTKYEFVPKDKPDMKYTFHIEGGILNRKVEKKWQNWEYTFIWNDPILISTSSGQITDEIFRMVRKWQLPEDMPLTKEALKLKDSIIVHWEYIAPFIKEKGLSDWDVVNPAVMSEYLRVIKAVENGDDSVIQSIRRFSEYNYKWVLEKTQFYKSATKPWDLFFIDIKDMGLENLKDHKTQIDRNIALNWGNEVNKTLNSGWIMTSAFQEAVSRLKVKADLIYPDSDIQFYIWWDEIWVFADWTKLTQSQTEKMMSAIHETLEEVWLSWRVASKNIKTDLGWNINSKEIFWALDMKTKVSKILEESLDLRRSSVEVRVRKWDLSVQERNNLLESLAVINNYDIHISRGWQVYVRFENDPFWVDRKYFAAEELVDVQNWQIMPDSIFTRFLDENGLWRRLSRSASANDDLYIKEVI